MGEVLTGVLTDVWGCVTSFITFANANTVVFGFQSASLIGRATVSLFRKAVSFGGGRRR